MKPGAKRGWQVDGETGAKRCHSMEGGGEAWVKDGLAGRWVKCCDSKGACANASVKDR